MPDIVQRIGFDSKDAIEQINLLNQALASLNAALGQTGTSISSWNSFGSQAVTQFNSMKTAADAARKAIEALSGAQQKAATEATKANVTPTQQLAPKPPPDLANYVAQIQTMGDALGAIPIKASESSRRAYASSIANLAQFAQANGVSLQQMQAAWTNSGTVVTGQGNKLANLTQSVKNSHQQMAQSAQQSTTQIGLSWQQMVQILEATAIHAIIHGFINMLKEGVVAAVDFGKRIAEDVTIMGDFGAKGRASIQSLSAEVIALSSKYGESATKIAEGYYQELSARVGTTTESLHVLNEAQQFAIATNINLADADKILTGVLNSYGMSAEHAGRVTDQLFSSVQRGRYHANELVNVLGKVNPIAHELGINFSEVMASLDTMTVAGTNVEVAGTQLRGIFNQLLKPTKELKEIMQSEWGVQNIEEAIRVSGGWVSFIQQLSDKAKNIQGLEEFSKNIRSLTGLVQISGIHVGKLKDGFEAIDGAMAGVAKTAAELVLETDAKKAEIAWNNLKLTFMKLGAEALPALTRLVEVINNLLNSGTALKGIFVSLGALAIVPAFEAIATATGLLTGKLSILASVFSSLTLGIGVAAFAGYELGELLQKLGKTDWTKIHKQQAEELKKAFEDNARANSLAVEKRQQQWANEASEAAKVVATMRLLTKEADDALQTQHKAFVASLDHRLSDLLKTEESVIQHLDSIIAGSHKKQLELNKELADNHIKQGEREFEWKNANVPQWTQLDNKQSRARELLDKGLHDVRMATNEDELNAAKQTLEEGGKYAKSVSEQAAQMGFLGNQLDHYRSQEREYYQDLDDVILRHQQILENNAKKADKERDAEVAIYTELKAAVLEVNEAFKTTGTAKTPEELAKQYQKAQDAISRIPGIIEKGLGGKAKVDIATMLGLADLSAKLASFEREIKPLKVKITGDFSLLDAQMKRWQPTILPAVQKEFPSVIGPAQAQEKLDSINKKLEAIDIKSKSTWKTQEQDIQGLAQYALPNLTTKLDQYNQKNETVTANIRLGRYLWPETYKATTEEATKLTNIVNSLKEALKLDPSTPEGFKKLREAGLALSQLQQGPLPLKGEVEILKQIRAEIDPILNEVITLNKEKASTFKNLGVAPEEVGTLKQQRELLKNQIEVWRDYIRKNPEAIEIFDTLMHKTEDTAKGASSFKTSLNDTNNPASQLQQTMSQIADDAWSAAEGMAQAASAAGGQFAATGGMIHLANGGMGRGTDTVPVMLTPGEFVMNSRATRRFFSQLVAMNAGTAPQGHATGGQVTNFGDINVSVNSGGSSRQTARDIATALRRELRRGTSVLN